MHELVIEPGRSEKNYWSDLWRYRELFYILAWRDISVRYKQTVIGVAWAVLRPFLAMVIFVIVFGRIAKMPSNGIPYPILVFAAMLPWQFFATSLSEASTSLVVNTNLVSKVYFPRMIIPAGAVITSLVDLLVSAGLLGVLMIWFRFMPDWRLLTLPLFTLMALLAALGPGLLLTALTVKYRDFRYVIPFVVQFGLFISPVGFSTDVIPANWRLLYSLNPVVGVIDGFRWAICRGESHIYLPGFILSLLVIFSFLWIGIWYFRKTEKGFADVI
ncbi:MAG TPA: ABC transporter permease [Chthoniobacterales bacterium]|jgi:lipopolysaccharide transport system permease protein